MKDAKKLKQTYQDDEIILPENIKAYQFNIEADGMAEVVALEQTREGFIAPTLNQTIWSLSQETMSLKEDDAE